MKIRSKKLKRKLLFDFLGYVAYNIIILTVAFFFNRFMQMLMFILMFDMIRKGFNYTFHANTIYPDKPIKAGKVCKLITIGVEITYLVFCKELNVSIYSNLFVIFLIALISALLQFYLERILTSKSLLKDKEYILTKGEEVGLSKDSINRLILRYVDNKSIQEIANLEYITVEAVKQSLRRSKRKLNM